MSAQTKAALEVAIAAHLADEMDGAILTGYAVVACGPRVEAMDDRTSYHYEFPPSQAFHSSFGLGQMLVGYLEDVRHGDN